MQESNNHEQPSNQPQEEFEEQFEQESQQSEVQSMTVRAVGPGPGLPTLRFGSSGNSVRVLQRLLVSNGYFVRIDGNFGALTETAVRAFQSGRGLRPDGVVGPRTWDELTG